MTSPGYYDPETGQWFYSRASLRHAQGNRKRALDSRIEKERRRLLGLGADPEWVERQLEKEREQ